MPRYDLPAEEIWLNSLQLLKRGIMLIMGRDPGGQEWIDQLTEADYRRMRKHTQFDGKPLWNTDACDRAVVRVDEPRAPVTRRFLFPRNNTRAKSGRRLSRLGQTPHRSSRQLPAPEVSRTSPANAPTYSPSSPRRRPRSAPAHAR